jgi:hypothetical protein
MDIYLQDAYLQYAHDKRHVPSKLMTQSIERHAWYYAGGLHYQCTLDNRRSRDGSVIKKPSLFQPIDALLVVPAHMHLRRAICYTNSIPRALQCCVQGTKNCLSNVVEAMTCVIRVVSWINKILRSVWAVVKHAMILFHHPVYAMELMDPCRIETDFLVYKLRGLCQMRETLPVRNLDNTIATWRVVLAKWIDLLCRYLTHEATYLTNSRI